MITRRGFLAASLLAIPGAKVFGGAIRMLPLKEAEYVISFGSTWPEPLTITTFTNGLVTGRYGTKELETIAENGWVRLRGIWCDGDTRCAELKVIRRVPETLDVDWIQIWGPKTCYRDDFFGSPPHMNSIGFESDRGGWIRVTPSPSAST